jgi:hypothetical protein
MPTAPKNETYEQKFERYIRAGYNVARTRKQNKDENGNVIASEESLQEQAIQYAHGQMAKWNQTQQARAARAEKQAQDDDEFRETQLELYRSEYEWNDSNDESSLEHLIELEVQRRQINRELEDPDNVNKDKLRTQLRDTIKAHKELQQALGIDKINREKSKTTTSPMNDWDRIKQEAAIKKQQMRDEFIGQAKEARSEAELRDRIKVGLLVGFDIVDAILSNHRRVLELPTEVSKH